MPDAEGEAIRRLIKTPESVPFPLVPGERVAVTPASQIARWYEGAGGLQEAVGQAQLAQAERLLSGQKGFPFRAWNADSLERPVAAMFGDPQGKLAFYSPAGKYRAGKIVVSPELQAGTAGAQDSLEHELGHAMFFYNDTMSDEQHTPLKAGPTDFGVSKKRSAYYRTPAEIDTRLAGIKRRYVFNTGKIPKDHAEAEQAIKWFVDNWQEPQGPDDVDTTDRDAAKIMLDMPEEERAKVLQRMLEVVNSHPMDALIARLG